MGLVELGIDPVRAVVDLVTDPVDSMRRYNSARRVKLYKDDFEVPIQEQIAILFRDEAVRQRLYQMARLSGSSSLMKRVADELARPIYAQPPRRTVLVGGKREASAPDQIAYKQVAKDVCLDGVMDLVARLLVPCFSVFLVARIVDEVGPSLDILTPDLVSVFPHPSVPTLSVALIYNSTRVVKGILARTYVVVDDKRQWEIDSAGMIIGEPKEHGVGRKPWAEIHRRHRFGCYWDQTTGQDLEVAALQSMVLDCIKLKKHKSQSHIQLTFNGETEGFVKDQVTDEESILISNGSGTLNTLDLQANPDGILKSVDALEMKSAANYGLSMDRMNHKGGGDDDGLSERVAELTKVMRAGEEDVFDLWRAVAKATGFTSISADAILSVDYGALHSRVDRKTQLDIHESEVRLGIASPLDAIYEKNPEIENDKEAWAEFEKNLADRSAAVEMLRALNMTADASPAMPGQNAQQNGALGPQVRDGKTTRDEAAEAATGANNVDEPTAQGGT